MERDGDWWKRGERCEEDGIAFCARCKIYEGYPRFVFITQGWSNAFHATTECSGLVDGQKMVDRRGGNPAPIVQVTIAEGHRKHEPCLICFPRDVGTDG